MTETLSNTRTATRTRLTQEQGALGVHVDKDDFYGGSDGVVRSNEFSDALRNHAQACGQIGAVELGGLNRAAGQVAQLLPLGFDDAKAGALQAGVNAKVSLNNRSLHGQGS